ncbi:MAG: hypothetical protein ABEI53_01770 [Candidatus Magasanikbacteria bacterium]
MSEENVSKTKIILTALGTATLVAIVSSALFFLRFIQSEENVSLDIDIQKKKEITRGVPFRLSANIENNTNTTLREVNLSFNISKGLALLKPKKYDRTMIKSLENISGNNLRRESLKLLPIDLKGDTETIKASLSYALGHTNFQKTNIKKIDIKKRAIKFNFDTPNKIVTGSSFESNFSLKNKSEVRFSNLEVKTNYPNGFEFISSNKPEKANNSYWDVGTLKPEEKKNLKIEGRVNNKKIKPIKVAALESFYNRQYEISQRSFTLTPAKSPLRFNVQFRGEPKLGNKIKIIHKYKNKSNTAFKNVKIESRLKGALFDFSTIDTSGDFRTSDGTTTWTPKKVDKLKTLEPGESGKVITSINIKENYSMNQLSDKNFSLKAEARIESDTVPYKLNAKKISSKDKKEVKIGSKTNIKVKALYRDPQSKILNRGPIPPEVSKKTQFTIHWEVKNKLADNEDVKITTKLPPNVKWTNRTKSNYDSVPIFKEKSRKVVWKIDKILAGRGYLNPALKAAFQVELVPKAEQIGDYAPLTRKTKMTFEDSFIEENKTIIKKPLNTFLPSDKTVPKEKGKVVPKEAE